MELKTQYNNHAKSFRHCECMNETEFSKHARDLKYHDFDSNVSRIIHKKA